MTQHDFTDTLPADTTTTDTLAGTTPGTRDGHPGEEVNAMARKNRSGVKRAWDEMSETDRQVLLETVRMRREAQAARDVRELQVFALRSPR